MTALHHQVIENIVAVAKHYANVSANWTISNPVEHEMIDFVEQWRIENEMINFVEQWFDYDDRWAVLGSFRKGPEVAEATVRRLYK